MKKNHVKEGRKKQNAQSFRMEILPQISGKLSKGCFYYCMI